MKEASSESDSKRCQLASPFNVIFTDILHRFFTHLLHTQKS
jgi:hypothetical protein